LGQAFQQPEHHLEQARLGETAVGADLDQRTGPAQVGQEPRELRPPGPHQFVQGCWVERAYQRPQPVGEGRVRQGLLADLNAGATEHPGARRLRPAGGLGDEAALADAGLPADQHHRRLTLGRPGQRRVETPELGVATHQRTGEAHTHPGIIVRGLRQRNDFAAHRHGASLDW
jgi:hypothetical protein